MNRREFFLTLLVQRRASPVEVEVMEVFTGSDGPSGLLVHHASESLRKTFGEWLRVHDGGRITCRHHGAAFKARIFRVKMCFGRGLILIPAALPIHVRAKERLNIE